ncbi:hypothetical protein AAY473_016516 [Plecturocebus cupreus]
MSVLTKDNHIMIEDFSRAKRSWLDFQRKHIFSLQDTLRSSNKTGMERYYYYSVYFMNLCVFGSTRLKHHDDIDAIRLLSSESGLSQALEKEGFLTAFILETVSVGTQSIPLNLQINPHPPRKLTEGHSTLIIHNSWVTLEYPDPPAPTC